ncbi:MAG: pilus assembly protein PilN [Legionellales bacterium]|nr:pilus assembly protein PilN [Legionellales bacterium]
MININLLPWRTLREKERQREFVFLLSVAIVLCIFICLIIHTFIARQLSKQLAVNDYFSQQIAVVDLQIAEVTVIKQQKNDLLRRLEIIQALETSRVLLVSMFHNFANILPNGIYITSIKKDHNLITVTGKARSNQQVSQLMQNIDTSPSFSDPVLTEIQDNTNNSQTTSSILDEVYSQGFELEMNETAPYNTASPSPASTSSSSSVPATQPASAASPTNTNRKITG